MQHRIMKLSMKLNPKDATEAVVDIFDDIDNSNYSWYGASFGAEEMATFLRENASVNTIKVRINSNGGDAFEGNAIYNLLKASGKRIEVEVVGVAASIASVIAMAGDTVKIHKTAMLMVHNCWTSVWGANAKALRKIADDMDKIMDSVKIAYLDKAGDKLDAKTLDELLEGETYLSASEALDYGLCDEVIGADLPKGDPENDEKDSGEQLDPAADISQQNMKCWFF